LKASSSETMRPTSCAMATSDCELGCAGIGLFGYGGGLVRDF
jgi:hypothetical protein